MCNKRPQAQEDLIGIWSYIAEKNRAAADQYLIDLEETLEFLSQNPFAAEAYFSRSTKTKGIRKCPVRNHIVFYLPQDDGIDVVRVLHSAMDIPRLLEKVKSEK
ncbi:MAG: hypothetical protein FD163_581 [Hyphomonadaceae bacterium]|nr:MAG: hypothetical protein FD128_1703 [Hyphomonadaceae bacterium]KAF0185913.1 MAG: hypothetical protein FD163_581 [Hyphomonadaceae bacterium]